MVDGNVALSAAVQLLADKRRFGRSTCAHCASACAPIRSSSAVNSYPLSANFMNGALELVLNCLAMRLTLPAGERRTVVSDGQFKSRHCGDDQDTFARSSVRQLDRQGAECRGIFCPTAEVRVGPLQLSVSRPKCRLRTEPACATSR